MATADVAPEPVRPKPMPPSCCSIYLDEMTYASPCFRTGFVVSLRWKLRKFHGADTNGAAMRSDFLELSMSELPPWKKLPVGSPLPPR
jgi:hypothetical protein